MSIKPSTVQASMRRLTITSDGADQVSGVGLPLVDLGVLEPYSTARYDRLYWNRRVFQVIDG
jgi:hypothetical protein